MMHRRKFDGGIRGGEKHSPSPLGSFNVTKSVSRRGTVS